MKTTRRQFIGGCCCASVAALAGARIQGVAFADADDTTHRDTLVVVFLRGGTDGLNFVAPADDKAYIAARSAELRVTDAGDNAGLVLANGPAGVDFRLHKSAAALKELYDSKALAIVQACGLTNGTRSHFDAMDLMERGLPDLNQKGLSSGWLTRHLISSKADGLFPAVGIGGVPESLFGSIQAVGMNDVGGFGLSGDAKLRAALKRMYAGDTPLHLAGQTTLQALQTLNSRIKRQDDGNVAPYQPANGVTYDGNTLGPAMQTLAQLIKMDLGVQVATVDYGGWDTHQSQAQQFPGLVEELSGALAAFYNDLSNHQKRLTVVVMSEFGRRLKSNESAGTDHGHGNFMFVLGGNVNGGRFYGTWPGLATEQLDSGADLAVTTDYRNVVSEILVRRMSNPQLSQVFPKFTAYKPLGITRGVDLKVS